MKPYIIGNILGKKAEAQRASDIIAFIEQNMPNNFGIYYKDQVILLFLLKLASK
ncbi:putative conjugative transfer protein TraG [Rickettsia hoogstraalii str. RCCE3]|nr:putative conjugative transfer protein TraG [Rickettsia hoogstraalii str. RCCE3]